MAQDNSTLFPCLFNTFNDVLKYKQKINLSIEEILIHCPDVCTLAYGNGNPDLSGQGVCLFNFGHSVPQLELTVSPDDVVLYA